MPLVAQGVATVSEISLFEATLCLLGLSLLCWLWYVGSIALEVRRDRRHLREHSQGVERDV